MEVVEATDARHRFADDQQRPALAYDLESAGQAADPKRVLATGHAPYVALRVIYLNSAANSSSSCG